MGARTSYNSAVAASARLRALRSARRLWRARPSEHMDEVERYMASRGTCQRRAGNLRTLADMPTV